MVGVAAGHSSLLLLPGCALASLPPSSERRRRAVSWNNNRVRAFVRRAGAKQPHQQQKKHGSSSNGADGQQEGRWSWLRNDQATRTYSAPDHDEASLLLGHLALRSVGDCLEAAQNIEEAIENKLARGSKANAFVLSCDSHAPPKQR